jgi:WD40 repeat protein
MKRLISAGKDKKIQVWDIFSQKNIITLNEHTEQINSIALSIDQRYLISGGDD